MTWKKRIISIVLCLCALLCAASVRAEAADTHSHPICGGMTGTTCTHAGDKHTSSQTWTAWDGTGSIQYTDNVAYIYLSDDVTLQINDDVWGKPKSLDVGNGKTLYLCLNGHSLTNRGSNTICVYGTLVLCDCKGGGQNNGTITHTKDTDGSFTGSEGIYVDSGAAFIMYGGTISENNGGVQAYKGTFTMYGGKISDNASRGVLVSGGTFTMYGGEISHNTCITESAEGGGGVWVKNGGSNIGNFTMYGGTICKNTYKGIGNCGGGGVYASGTGDFIIQGGKITNNQCSYNATDTSATTSGGGLYISGKPGKLKIENCTISNNTCDGEGGGIFINCANVTGTITGCTISGNEAGGKGGGFASQYCTLTIGNCNITDNRTAGKGGAMAVGSWNEDSKITLSGSMNFSGNAQGCTAGEDGKLTGDTANDVHLNTRSVYLRLADDFSKTSTAIVVTTASEPNAYGCKKIAEDNRTTPNPGDFKYGNDDTIGIIAKTKADGTTVELLACKHNYSTQKDETNHWQECSICGDKKDVAKHTYSTDWQTNSTKHWHECACGQRSGEAKHSYSSDWKTDNSKHWHECACGQKSGEADHAYSNEWKTGDGKHWHECECGQKSGEAAHSYSTAWKTGDGKHWHECVCGQKSGEAAHSYSTAWKTGDGKHWHECACGQKSGEAEHSYSTAWDRDNTSHFHKCSACGDKTDIAICVYKARVTSGHQKSDATCTAKAVYWKSCVCDRESTETFESGEKNPNNHTGQLGNWQTSTDEHWKVYSCCQAQSDKAAHAWNEGEVTTPATCTAAGVKTYTCAVCSATKTEPVPATGHTYNQTKVEDKYLVSAATCTAKAVYYKSCVCGATGTATFKSGNSLGHDFSVRQYGENDHWMKCSRCDATDTKEAHSGGEATCTQKAVCEKCGQKYGDLKAHDFANGPYRYDGEQHWKKCANCDATDTKEAHSGGEATCTQKAVCEKCGQEYGEKLAHSYTVQEHNEIQHWYKCANCTATTEPVAHTDFTAWKSDSSGHWYECSTCGYKTAVTAHTPDRDKATETEAKVCKDCDWVIAPATHPNHTWVFVAETPATCNAAGEREHYKCTCGRTSFKNGDTYAINEDASVLTIEKNSANHTGAPDSKWHSDSANHWQEYTCCYARANEAAHSGGAATCTAQAVCQVCGKAYGPLAGHDWGAWKVTTPATKDAPGAETRTCTHNSAHTETRSIPKLSTAVYTVSEDTKIAQIEAKVDGLDKILELNENKALVNDGKSVGVSLTVKNTASSGVSEKIKEKLAGSNLVGLRLELTVEKTVTANGVVESKQTIPDAGVLLKTTITLPAELQGKSGYVVYRLHDGNVHVLTETANENGEFISVSADKTQITICARLYSEYVIAYQTGGSSGGGYHPVNPTPVKATSANTGDAGVLLYGVTAALSLTGTAWLGAKSRKH